jgi:hypothetical protein
VKALAVGRDARVLAAVVGGRGDVDRERRAGEKTPDRACGPVAERRVVAAGQQRGHPPAPAAQRDVADREDAAEHGAQTARLDRPADRRRTQACGEQLRTGDDPVLVIGDGADQSVAMCGAFFSHTEN